MISFNRLFSYKWNHFLSSFRTFFFFVSLILLYYLVESNAIKIQFSSHLSDSPRSCNSNMSIRKYDIAKKPHFLFYLNVAFTQLRNALGLVIWSWSRTGREIYITSSEIHHSYNRQFCTSLCLSYLIARPLYKKCVTEWLPTYL